MEEFVPVLISLVLGLPIGRYIKGSARFPVSLGAAAVSAALATLVSGEFNTSWAYLLLDLAEAALGVALAFGVLRLRQVTHQRRARPHDAGRQSPARVSPRSLSRS